MMIGAIVQARMSSVRFPGKVLHPVDGKPLLGYLLDRLDLCRSIEGRVVATSAHPADLAIAEFCAARSVECVRGSLSDVAGRFLDVLDAKRWDAFVRVSGDSPLLDAELVDRAVRIFREGGADLVTNVFPRSFPKGQSVEVVRTSTFRSAVPRFLPADREHVTTWFYREPAGFVIRNFAAGEEDLSGVQLSVDTPADMEAFRLLVSRMDRSASEYPLREILDLLRVRT